MAEPTTDQPTPEGQVLLISAVFEPRVQFDPKQMQIRFEAEVPFENPKKEYIDMVDEIAQSCVDVARKMLDNTAIQALVNEVGVVPGSQDLLFAISFRATGGTGSDCTFSAEAEIPEALMTASDRLVQRTADECKEASLPIFTRRYPDCGV